MNQLSPGGDQLDLNQIQWPKFSPPQLLFFAQMIRIYQQDRLNIDPASLPKKVFDLQWVSLQSMENTFKFLIDGNNAVVEAERDERINGSGYNPQQLLADVHDDSIGVDLNNLSI
jgi:hypothetical protein